MKSKMSLSLLSAVVALSSLGVLPLRGLDASEDAWGAVDSVRAASAGRDAGNWLLNGRDYSDQHFSPLSQIDEHSVSKLGLAWTFKVDVDRGMQSTPIVVDGVMYTSGPFSMVYALDARTGALLWRYDPEVDRSKMNRVCCDAVNRGVAVWRGKVFIGAIDGRLIALDARTGKEQWSADTVIDHDRNYSITGAPRVFRDKVVIGNAGAEYGVRGYVTAYDTETGKQAWRFYTVPGDPRLPPEDEAMKIAMPTWHGSRYAELGGGGTVWDAMAYDPELNLFYIGVGNGGPHSRLIRSEGKGDNLFLSSIVAVDGDTGRYVWHYQTTPGDEWDYTATQNMILADLKIDGRVRKVIMQAPKNGYFYVLDRKTGKLISADNYVPVSWAKGIDLETGRPIIDEQAARYEDGKLKIISPASVGGHNWQPMSYNPRTGLVYIPAMINAMSYKQAPGVPGPGPGVLNIGIIGGLVAPMTPGERPSESMLLDATKSEDLQKLRATWQGKLIAWDPVRQKEVWSRPHPSMWNGATLTSAGNLVFQGSAEGVFAAYRASDGKLLWQSATNAGGVIAAPISYRVDGEQYIAVSAGKTGLLGFGGAVLPNPTAQSDARVMVYKIGGKAPLPPGRPDRALPAAFPFTFDPAKAKQGYMTYSKNCVACHGMDALSNGLVPDLRYMDVDTIANFSTIVRGAYASVGMPDLSDRVSDADIDLILNYLAKRNQDLRAQSAGRK